MPKHSFVFIMHEMKTDTDLSKASLAERGRLRRLKIQTYQARNYQDAEDWDLKYWQSQGPEGRLNAYMAIRDDIEKVNQAKNAYSS